MPRDIRRDFGQRLTEAMRRKKVSQTEAATWINAGQSTLSDWMRGHTAPPIDQAAILAERLGVSLDFLAGVSGTASELTADPVVDVPPASTDGVRDRIAAFGAHLKSLLYQRGITYEQVGSWLNVTRAQVGNWTSARRDIRLHEAAEIAFRLGVSLDHMVGLDGSPPPNMEDVEETIHISKRQQANAAADIAALIVELGVDEARRRLRGMNPGSAEGE